MSGVQNIEDSVLVQSMETIHTKGAKDDVSAEQLDETKQSTDSKLKRECDPSNGNYSNRVENNVLTVLQSIYIKEIYKLRSLHVYNLSNINFRRQ